MTQHRKLNTALDEVARALTANDQRGCENAVFRLLGAVEAHFDVEEQVLFPALHASHAELSPEIDALVGEHESLRRTLESLSMFIVASESAAVIRVLEEFRGALAEHEIAEEALIGRGS